MAGFNRIIMIGNLTRDPDYKQLSSGQAVCRISLASNRQFKNKQTGTLTQEVCFIDIDVWGPQAESCRQYLQKGRAILVEGRLKFDNWKDQEGQARNKHSIVADRVIFLTSNSTEIDTNKEETFKKAKNTIDSQLEKELIDQIEEIQSKSSKDATESIDHNKTPKNINFKDEQPFEDDLPF